MLVGALRAVFLHEASVPVGKHPLGVVHHLYVPVGDASRLVGCLVAVYHRVESADGAASLAVAAVFGHVFLPVRVGAFQQVVVQRTLYQVLYALHVARQLQPVVHLAHADGRVRVGHHVGRYVHRLSRRGQRRAARDVAPADAVGVFHRLPREDVEAQPLLHDVQVQVFQRLLHHLVLSPHVVLLVAKEEQLIDGQLAEYRVAVARLAVHRLAPVVVHFRCRAAHDVQPLGRTAQYLLQQGEEGALLGLGLHHAVEHAQRAHVAVFGVLQGAERVNARQLQLVQLLVVALRQCHRLYVAGKHARVLAVDVHHRVAARAREEVCHVVCRQQPHRGLTLQHHVKRVVHLALRLHRVLAKPQSALPVAYLFLLRAVALRHDLHRNLLVALIVEVSVYIHIIMVF